MRKACWTCRKRTIQCDQSRIPCAKCEKAGLECFEERPLRWVKGIAIRGKMRGRVLESGTKSVDENSNSQRVKRRQIPSLAANNPPAFTLRDPRIQHLPWSSRFYLDYYNMRITTLFILYDSYSNPFRTLLSYSMVDSTLQKCLIAVAARHFANTGKSFDPADKALSPRFVKANLDALYFKRETIRALSLSLSHTQPSQRDTIMATVLLLIFLDLLESGIEGWKCHLQGAQNLVRLSRSLLESSASGYVNNSPGETIVETRRFFARQFSLISTIGGALSGSELRAKSFIDFHDNANQESIIRSFLGCPGFLLRAIYYFSNQRDVIATVNMHDNISTHKNVQDTLNMLELAANFDCLEWASEAAESAGSSAVNVRELALLSQAYRSATVLYGNRVLSSFQPSSRHEASKDGDLVSGLLDTIHTLKCNAGVFKCLLWPTFIVGLESKTPSQQEQVIGFLKVLWDLTCCLNVIGASTLLHDYWKLKDVSGELALEVSKLQVMEQGWLLI